MPTMFAFHEVEDGERWAGAWRKEPGSRHEMFAKIGVKARTFRDPDDPEVTGVLIDVPDVERFEAFMQTDEARRAMEEDGLKVDTFRILEEFTP